VLGVWVRVYIVMPEMCVRVCVFWGGAWLGGWDMWRMSHAVHAYHACVSSLHRIPLLEV
jgi:hypothetical protein